MDYAAISIGTNAITTTTNTIRMVVIKNSDPTVIVQSIDEPGPTHNARIWSFANLERVMHNYKLLEINSSNQVIGTILGPVDFLPAYQSFQYKRAVLIQAGVTPIPGDLNNTPWPVGVNSVTVPDWLNWQIESFVYPGGIGELKYDVNTPLDMDWTATTAFLELKGIGVTFQQDEYYIVHFKPRQIDASGGLPSAGGGTPSDKKFITNNTTLSDTDIGKKIIIRPAGNYVEVIVPDLIDVPEFKPTWFTMDVAHDNTNGFINKCAVIKTVSGQIINWLEGNLSQIEMCPSEHFVMSKVVESISPMVQYWCIENAHGEWFSVGEGVYDDINAKNVINKVPVGAELDANACARLYNRYVSKLPSDAVVAYPDWNNGNNKYKWSLKNSSGKFFSPNLKNIFNRVNDGNSPSGTYADDTVIQHEHEQTTGSLPSAPFGKGTTQRVIGNYNGTSNSVSDLTGGVWVKSGLIWIPASSATETAPKHRKTNQYFKC